MTTNHTPTQCKAKVSTDNYSPLHQCTRAATVGEFCRQHDPIAAAEKTRLMVEQADAQAARAAHVRMCVNAHDALTARVAELEAALAKVADLAALVREPKIERVARAALAKGVA